MAARSVSLDNGPAIPGTVFRHMITANDTDGRFSAQSAVLAPRELVIPHSHEWEDEFTIVCRGRIGGLSAGFEHFFEEMGALTHAEPQTVQEISARYGQRPHPELVRGLQERHSVHL